MSRDARWLLAVICFVVIAAVGAYAATAFISAQQRLTAAPSVDTAPSGQILSSPRIVFRNTDVGGAYGLVAAVALDDPSGPREVTDLACDRIDASATASVCLRTHRGIVTTFEATLYTADGDKERTWQLSGLPSRTRLADSGYVATTAFVTGHSYATIGFSTETVIQDASGTKSMNLEQFRLLIDGQENSAADRNFWGVTFASDADTFYATAASSGQTWLVRGSLRERTLASVTDAAECPSISPDGKRIAYKKNVATGPVADWRIAVYNLADGSERLLPGDRTVDDQVEWLDDDTILYGLPRQGVAGDSDVWAVSANGSSDPSIFIEHAWSPSVVLD
jgi:hypothetical protein